MFMINKIKSNYGISNVNNIVNGINILNISGIKFIHNTSILNSNLSNNNLNKIIDGKELNQLLNENLSERISDLQLVKYEGIPVSKENNVPEITSFQEAFPWFTDEDGKIYDYNQSISLFDGIKLISRFLEIRCGLDKEQFSDVKIGEFIAPFQEKEVKVKDLFDHVANLHKTDSTFLSKVYKDINNDMLELPSNFLAKKEQLFGQYGEITINDLASKITNYNWKVNVGHIDFMVHALPAVVSTVGFGIVLKTYLRLIHNRSYPAHFTAQQIMYERQVRNKYLALFTILGAPFVLLALKSSAIPLKDIVTINVNAPFGESNPSISEPKSSSMVSEGSFFILLSKLNKKIPDWLKLTFKILFSIYIILKLLGFSNILDFFNSIYYIKIFFYISFSLLILYYFIILYLIHIFSTREIKISEMLPDSLIESLKGYQILSQFEESRKSLKKLCYQHIGIYITFLLISILLF